jgi:anti-anti-sigma regulatory factor
MARIVAKKSGRSILVEISGEAGSAHAAKARDFFLSVVAGGYGACTVDLNKTTLMDMQYLQMLLSFQRSMEKSGEIVIFLPLPEEHPVLKFFTDAGIPLTLIFPQRR